MEFTKFKDNVVDLHHSLQVANDMVISYCRHEKKFVQIKHSHKPTEQGVYVEIYINKEEANEKFAKSINHIYEEYTNCTGIDICQDSKSQLIQLLYFKSYNN